MENNNSSNNNNETDIYLDVTDKEFVYKRWLQPSIFVFYKFKLTYIFNK